MGTPPGTTKTWGKRSAHVLAIAPGAVLMVALAGCSLGNPTLNEPAPLPANEADAGTQPPTTSSDERPAFHFASGDLILGDFTYEDVAGNIFNPCEEISAEEFAAIGFETDGVTKRYESMGLNGCVLEPSEASGSQFLLAGGSANYQATSAQRSILQKDASDVLPRVYTFADDRLESDYCGAAVDTERGQLGSIVGSVSSSETMDELCSEAVSMLEKLFQ